MTLLTILVLILTLSIPSFIFIFSNLLNRKSQTDAQSQSSHFEQLLRIFENRLNSLQQQIESRMRDQNNLLSNSHDQIGKRLDNAAHVVGKVQNTLGQLEEANKRIFEVGKDIQGLQDILRAPKQRGVLGELFLADLLSQILPNDHYKLQHTFKNNEKVDALICLAHGFVSVDAKFPLENFSRYLATSDTNEREQHYRALVADTKKHIDAIAAKYIVPDEGTLDFALMYIPAENVYYELTLSDYRVAGQRSLIEYALEKRVIPVSPNTLFAYLQTVLLGLRGLKIEERARGIQDLLLQLRLDFNRLNEDLGRLGKHLNNATGSFSDSMKRFERIHGRLDTIEDGEHHPESAVLETAPAIIQDAPL